MTSRGRKSNDDYFNTANGCITAEYANPPPDDLMSQIRQIRETFPNISKENAAIVLQSCDCNLEKAFIIITQDEGQSILASWNFQGKKRKTGRIVAKNRRKRNKKQRNQGEKQKSSSVIEIGVQETDKYSLLYEAHPENTSSAKIQVKASDFVGNVSGSLDMATYSSSSSRKSSVSLQSENPPLPSSLRPQTDKYPSFPKPGATSRVREAKRKEVNVIEAIPRSKKDLHRSAIAISRFHMVHEDKCNDAEKQIKDHFKRIRESVSTREKILLQELQKIKEEATKLLDERQEKAASLKGQCDQVSRLKSEEVQQLRAEIKHFVGDRKIDEEVANTNRFFADCDNLIEAIESYGQIIKLKADYKSRWKLIGGQVITDSESRGQSLLERVPTSVKTVESEALGDSAETKKKLANAVRRQHGNDAEEPPVGQNKESTKASTRTVNDAQMLKDMKSTEDDRQNMIDDGKGVEQKIICKESKHLPGQQLQESAAKPQQQQSSQKQHCQQQQQHRDHRHQSDTQQEQQQKHQQQQKEPRQRPYQSQQQEPKQQQQHDQQQNQEEEQPKFQHEQEPQQQLPKQQQQKKRQQHHPQELEKGSMRLQNDLERRRSGKERIGKERSGKERSGKERSGKERSGKERIGKERSNWRFDYNDYWDYDNVNDNWRFDGKNNSENLHVRNDNWGFNNSFNDKRRRKNMRFDEKRSSRNYDDQLKQWYDGRGKQAAEWSMTTRDVQFKKDGATKANTPLLKDTKPDVAKSNAKENGGKIDHDLGRKKPIDYLVHDQNNNVKNPKEPSRKEQHDPCIVSEKMKTNGNDFSRIKRSCSSGICFRSHRNRYHFRRNDRRQCDKRDDQFLSNSDKGRPYEKDTTTASEVGGISNKSQLDLQREVMPPKKRFESKSNEDTGHGEIFADSKGTRESEKVIDGCRQKKTRRSPEESEETHERPPQRQSQSRLSGNRTSMQNYGIKVVSEGQKGLRDDNTVQKEKYMRCRNIPKKNRKSLEKGGDIDSSTKFQHEMEGSVKVSEPKRSWADEVIGTEGVQCHGH